MELTEYFVYFETEDNPYRTMAINPLGAMMNICKNRTHLKDSLPSKIKDVKSGAIFTPNVKINKV